jgi:tRNA nucleotidyltransferase (CCA-adding enzyme)
MLIKPQLIEALNQKIAPQVVASEIMSKPVKTIRDTITIEEASGIMLRYGHTGMPVMDEHQKICGIISRTDIEKAVTHKLGHAPVKAFMSHEVISITPKTSINEINDLLVTHNIGRLPVLEKGKLVGIVTRTDLLRYLHGSHNSYWYQKVFLDTEQESINRIQAMEQLSTPILSLLRTAGEIGDQLDQRVYVVGGFVRDLLLKAENWDIDLVTEGDGISFARELHKITGGKLTVHDKFETAVLRISGHITLDIVTARREYYEHPAALPKVEKSNIWNDLFRRDFTINCMAITLNPGDFGTMVDYFGGLKDLQNREIRVLYNLSFIEDPTRIFRAVRFAARLGFAIEKSTRQFMEHALKTDTVSRLSKDRIREELLHLIREQEFLPQSVVLMKDLDLFRTLHPHFKVETRTIERIRNIRFSVEGFRQLAPKPFNQTIVLMMQLMSEVPEAYLEQVSQLLIANQSLIQQIVYSMKQRECVYEVLHQDEVDKYTIYKLLDPLPEETLVFYYNDTEDPYVRHYIAVYMLKLKNIRLTIDGNDLRDLNIRPGPIYKRILENVLKAKVLGTIYDRDSELKYAERLYQRMKEETHV